jgi:UDP-sugar transporter A1/2/3
MQVAVTIKYADNILRGFAQALALIIGAIGSWVIFDFHLTFMFSLGCALVIGAVFLYGSSANSPQELCEALAGCGAPAAKDSVADKASLVDAEGGVGSDDEEARGSGAPSATPATK